MKRLTFVICLVVLALAAQAKDKEFKITIDQMPEKAQTFVSDNFQGLAIKKITQKFDDGIAEYNVYFKDKTVVEFDMTGAWNEIQVSKKGSISRNILPPAVRGALDARFPDLVIKKVENDGYKYDIDLSDGTDIDIYANGVIKD